MKSTSLPVVLAAGLVLAAGVLIAVRSGLFSPHSPPTSRDALVRAAEDLARIHPDLFKTFVPLSRSECVSRDMAAIRGDRAYVLIHPSGKVLDTRPAFRWETRVNKGPQVIRLMTLRGKTVWSRPTTASPEVQDPGPPPLVRGGRYLWSLTPPGKEVPVAGMPFEVVSEAQHRAFTAAMAAIEAADPDYANLIKAHFAIRGDYYREAETAIRTHLRNMPGDAVGRETLYYLLSRVGASEAETLGIKP